MTKSEMSYAAKAILFCVVAIVIITVGSYAYKYVMAPVAGKSNAEWQIESAESRISAYNHFFDQCVAIQGYEASIEVQEEALKTAVTPEDKSRIQTVVLSVKAQRMRAAAQYNADVKKAYTLGRFKDSAMPEQIDDSLKGKKTQCAN